MKVANASSIWLPFGLLVLATTLFTAVAAASSPMSVLHQFKGKPAQWPVAGLTADAQGNLYGVSTQGGPGNGIVFELAKTSGGGWQYHILYHFKGGNDGEWPIGGLFLDQAGNIYGTTDEGGNLGTCQQGCGTVFELSPSNNGWSEKVIFRFDGKNGSSPEARLVMDSAGNLYGTTVEGGSGVCSVGDGGCGTIFELTSSGGKWKHKILYDFTGGSDGQFLRSPVVFDASGNLYGTTLYGSAPGFGGTIFELSPSGGHWTLNTLYSMSGPDGQWPVAGVALDSQGNLYGATEEGGKYNQGVVFEVSPSGGGWTEQVIHDFTNGNDGSDSLTSPIIDAEGNLYGAAAGAGKGGYGTVFKMTPGSGGSWTFKVLYSFTGGADGGNPVDDRLVIDPAGFLYGTTDEYGDFGFGTVFKIKP